MKNYIAVPALVIGFASSASAFMISGTGDPLTDANLAGGTQIDFETTTLGTYNAINVGGVTFTANDYHLRIDNTYQGYNQQGIYLDNGVYGNRGFGSLTISFTGTTDAFGFTWGMAESSSQWQLTAYDSSNSIIESVVLPSTQGSSAGEYYGISASGISYATLVWNGNYDWVAIDNVTYLTQNTSVPEPATLSLLGLGLLGLGASRKRARKA